MNGPHGWIILDKPHGLGSTQAVAAVKRNLREAGLLRTRKGAPKTRVGHGGTLDPLATGVLPIAVGEATKLTGRMLDASKLYDYTIRFGEQTDTLDVEGAVVATSAHRPTLADVQAVLPRFTGPISQVPPAYSALKVDGERAYDRARAGEDVVLRAREVTIYALIISSPPEGEDSAAYARSALAELGEGEGSGKAISSPSHGEGNQPKAGGGGRQPGAAPHSPYDSPAGCHLPTGGEELQEITLTAHVSKGTYIRSLARDIALALDTVGHVTMLRRTRAGPFGLDQAISLDKLNEIGKGAPITDALLPLEAGLADIPALTLSPDQAEAIRQGRVVEIGIPVTDGPYWARDGDQKPLALVTVQDGIIRVSRGLNI